MPMEPSFLHITLQLQLLVIPWAHFHAG
jgi:hypothetical protein